MRQWIAVAFLALPAIAHAQTPNVEPAFTSAGAFMAFSVPDLESSTRWYSEKLGLKVIMRATSESGVSVRVLEGGGLIVELQHNRAAVPLATAAPSIQHTTLVHGIFKAGIIVQNYERVLATLRQRQVPIVMGPFPAQPGQRANFIIRDNAGNLLQFIDAQATRQ